MSALVETTDREVLFADDRDQQLAKKLVDQFPAAAMRFRADTAASENAVQVPAELSELIGHVLSAVARGATVTVGTMPDELTTTAASQLLGISRPKLMRDIDAGLIAAHKVGSHTRLHTVDVLQARDARLQRQRDALQELNALLDEDDD